MKNRKSVAQTVIAYLLWIILAAGSVLILLLGRTALLAALAGYSSRGFTESMQVGLMDKGYFIFGAIAILSFCVAMEVSLSKAPEWRILIRKALIAFTVEFYLVTAVTAVAQLYAGILFATLIGALSIVIPACAGTACITALMLTREKE